VRYLAEHGMSIQGQLQIIFNSGPRRPWRWTGVILGFGGELPGVQQPMVLRQIPVPGGPRKLI
jgi:hypothetical protein